MRRVIALHPSVKVHAEPRSDANEDAVKKTKQSFLTDNAACSAALKLSERHPTQRHCQCLATGIPRLSRKDRQENGKNHKLIERFLEYTNNRCGDERSE